MYLYTAFLILMYARSLVVLDIWYSISVSMNFYLEVNATTWQSIGNFLYTRVLFFLSFFNLDTFTFDFSSASIHIYQIYCIA